MYRATRTYPWPWGGDGNVVIVDHIVSHGENNDDNKTYYTGLTLVLCQLKVMCVLCTPTLWAKVEGRTLYTVPSLEVVALRGGYTCQAEKKGGTSY